MTAESGALTNAEQDALARAVDRATLATTSKAAVAWGMPLLDILNTEGHDAACDALAAENVTLCDCWWGRVKTAAEALSQIATLADEALAALGPGDLATTVESFIAVRYPSASSSPEEGQ